MTQKELIEKMDAKEFFKWMAYETSVDPDNHKKYMAEIKKQQTDALDDESRANLIKNMLNIVGNN